MKNETVENLVRLWSELEPDKCIVQEDGDITVMWYGYFNIAAHSLNSGLDPWDIAIIQGAVQDAIRARGWIYRLALQRDGETGEFMNYATVAVDEFDVSRNGHHAQRFEALEALLTAYLKALEVQQ